MPDVILFVQEIGPVGQSAQPVGYEVLCFLIGHPSCPPHGSDDFDVFEVRANVGRLEDANLVAQRGHRLGRSAVHDRRDEKVRRRAERLYLGRGQSRRTVDDDQVESVAHRSGMQHLGEGIADVLRLEMQAEHEVCRPSAESLGCSWPALEEPLDQDTVVGLRQVIVGGDHLKSAGRVGSFAKVHPLREGRYKVRRDVITDHLGRN